MITFLVGKGDGQRVIKLHEDTLPTRYFRASLGDNFLEGKTGTIELDDVDPDMFKCYGSLSYFGSYGVSIPLNPRMLGLPGEDLKAYLPICIKIWILANRFLHKQMQTPLEEAILLQLKKRFMPSELKLLHDSYYACFVNTPDPVAPYDRKILDAFCKNCSSDLYCKVLRGEQGWKPRSGFVTRFSLTLFVILENCEAELEVAESKKKKRKRTNEELPSGRRTIGGL